MIEQVLTYRCDKCNAVYRKSEFMCYIGTEVPKADIPMGWTAVTIDNATKIYCEDCTLGGKPFA